MDQVITTVIGMIIFTAFVAGLAESIGALPFIIIVSLVVAAMGYNAFEVFTQWLKPGNSKKSSN